MFGIENKLICLNLNSAWQPIGCKIVKEAMCDLVGGDYLAIDIQYEKLDNGSYDFSTPKNLNPVLWSEWLNLPVRDFDFFIRSKTLCVRVPTVLITKSYSKMPRRRICLNRENVRIRDKNTCQYTGKILKPEEGNIDHVIPKDKGGAESWENLVFCDKSINAKKGNNLNQDVGLKLIKTPKEPSSLFWTPLLAEDKHCDWKHFLIK